MMIASACALPSPCPQVNPRQAVSRMLGRQASAPELPALGAVCPDWYAAAQNSRSADAVGRALECNSASEPSDVPRSAHQRPKTRKASVGQGVVRSSAQRPPLAPGTNLLGATDGQPALQEVS
mmetsp:Transcript_58008/g.161883  ORF Transcript_58008/g.161883 Transcript_58008/m.161883 type:complete len:123 (-) Transcript_58008:125-493(-)